MDKISVMLNSWTLLLFFLIPYPSSANQCRELFNSSIPKPIYSNLEAWNHEAVLYPDETWAKNIGSQLPKFLSHFSSVEKSWAMFSDPRISEVQMGPIIFSRENQSTRLSKLTDEGAPVNFKEFRDYEKISRFLNRTTPPGALITGAVSESVSPFYDLNYYSDTMTGSLTWDLGITSVGTPNKLSFETTGTPFDSIISGQFPEIYPLSHWRELSGYSQLGHYVIGFHGGNQALQSFIVGYKLLFNLLEELHLENSISDPRVRELAEKIWQSRFNLGNLEVSHDADLFDQAGHSAHTLAVTNLEPGSDIYLNSEILQKDPLLSLDDSIALLAHELGHNMGLEDTPDRFLDYFGAQIKEEFAKRTQVREIKTAKGHKVFVHFVKLKKANGQKFTYFLLRDSSGWADLTPSFFNLVDGANESFDIDQFQYHVESIDDRSELLEIHFRVNNEQNSTNLKYTILGAEKPRPNDIAGFHIIERLGPKIKLEALPSNNQGSSKVFQVKANSVSSSADGFQWTLKTQLPQMPIPQSAVFHFSRVESPLTGNDRETIFSFPANEIKQMDGEIQISGDISLPKNLVLSQFKLEKIETVVDGENSETFFPEFRTLSDKIGKEKPETKLQFKVLGAMQLHPYLAYSQNGEPGGASIVIKNTEKLVRAELSINVNEGEMIIDLSNPPEFMKVTSRETNNELNLEIEIDSQILKNSYGGNSLLFQNLYIQDQTFNESNFNFRPNTLFGY